jgi:cytochrome c5
LLIALMIVLLPVRGWVGDAMATTMGLQQAALSAAAATPQDTSAADPAIDEACTGCSTCQMCHTVAIAVLPSTAQAPARLEAAPAGFSASFTSVSRAPGFKPPIF